MGKGRIGLEEIVYSKLIRAKIPEVIVRDGEVPITKELDDCEFKTELENY